MIDLPLSDNDTVDGNGDSASGGDGSGGNTNTITTTTPSLPLFPPNPQLPDHVAGSRQIQRCNGLSENSFLTYHHLARRIGDRLGVSAAYIVVYPLLRYSHSSSLNIDDDTR